MLESKYANCSYCNMCYRLFRAPRSGCSKADVEEDSEGTLWVEHSPDDVLKFARASASPISNADAMAEAKWQSPPYLKQVETAMLAAKLMGKKSIILCQHCTAFMRKHQHHPPPPLPNGHKAMLPMHVVIKYIMSGGCSHRPCQKMLAHCVESLVFRFPSNPIVVLGQDNEGVHFLRERVQLLARHLGLFFDNNDTDPHYSFVCLLRWVAEVS